MLMKYLEFQERTIHTFLFLAVHKDIHGPALLFFSSDLYFAFVGGRIYIHLKHENIKCWLAEYQQNGSNRESIFCNAGVWCSYIMSQDKISELSLSATKMPLQSFLSLFVVSSIVSHLTTHTLCQPHHCLSPQWEMKTFQLILSSCLLLFNTIHCQASNNRPIIGESLN